MLVTWERTSTLVSGVTVPAASSRTRKSRLSARTVLTVMAGPAPGVAAAGALAGVAGTAPSVLPPQPIKALAATLHISASNGEPVFMVFL